MSNRINEVTSVGRGDDLAIDEGTEHGVTHPLLLGHALLENSGHDAGGGLAQGLVVGVANSAGRDIGV